MRAQTELSDFPTQLPKTLQNSKRYFHEFGQIAQLFDKVFEGWCHEKPQRALEVMLLITDVTSERLVTDKKFKMLCDHIVEWNTLVECELSDPFENMFEPTPTVWVREYGLWALPGYFSSAPGKLVAGPEDAWKQQLKVIAHAKSRLHWMAFLALSKSATKHPKVTRHADDDKATNYLYWSELQAFEEVRRPLSFPLYNFGYVIGNPANRIA